MRRLSVFLLVIAEVMVLLPAVALAADFQVLTGKPFDQSLVTNFYLEGQAIPAQKRNATLIKTPSGARVLIALLDTSGYGADITQKYNGLLITEGTLNIGGKALQPGSYGFGLTPLAAGGPPTGSKIFRLYNQAGAKLLETKAARDEVLSRAKPLQVVTKPGKPARLYVGRDWVELQ
ncbi:MAG: hypothetical protein EHM23_08615 [Acidobacteria bacterium]|nr:MAG: hypothetical protein EHM23_08615 [Acidobacteriota bacterium]